MKILCVFGRHAYGDPARGEGYEHANFLPAFAALRGPKFEVSGLNHSGQKLTLGTAGWYGSQEVISTSG